MLIRAVVSLEYLLNKKAKDTFDDAILDADFRRIPVLVTGEGSNPGMPEMLRALKKRE